MGLPTATEALDPITPQYLQDLICWSAIGARTTESQTHREMASGLSSAVGFKNGTDGSLDVAINALKSVQHPHRFLGINSEGVVSIFETRGNPYGHVVLVAAVTAPTTTALILRNVNLRSQKRVYPPTLWWIVVTLIRARITTFSHWLYVISAIRY